MQKLTAISLLLLIVFLGCQEDVKKDRFSIEPSNPQIGDEISIQFIPDDTKLDESNSVEMVLYQYDIDLLNTSSIEMTKNEGSWNAKFTPDKNTKGIVILFKDEEIVENNNSTGYIINLNDESGNPLPEALAGHAVALAQWGSWYAGLKADNSNTVKLFEEIFVKYPDVKDSYLNFYLYILSRVGNDESMVTISKELDLLKEKDTLTENEIVALARYSDIIGKKKDAKKYEALVLKDYPNSKFAIELEYKSKMEKESGDELKKDFKQLLNKYPDSELNKVASYRIIKNLIDANNIEDAISTAKEFANITHPYAFTYSVKKVSVAKDFKSALKLAILGVEANRNHLEKKDLEQPKYLSKPEWQNELEYNLAEALKLLAIVQNRLDDNESALTATEEAQKFLKGSDVELNELYSSLLIDAEKFEEAKINMENYLTENKGSNEILDLLKIAFANTNGSSDGFDEYVGKFATAGEAKLMEKLKGEMIDEPAPDFELNNLKGEPVKFSDYKGKIVIVDFWATWCGPCKRSFPAMQDVNNKYINDPNVEFLFINTWERVDDKVTNANLFIKGNGYSLNVLMDVNNEVVTKFKVTGIPTKFIIGPDQKIKFKSVGFAGTNEELVKELSAMISLIK